MQTVHVHTSERDYDVVIGPGLLREAPERIAGVVSSPRIAIVTDETVASLHGARLAEDLRQAGTDARTITVPAGEQSKSWAVAGSVLEQLIAAGMDRTSAVVALGGGVVGDLAGFCAAVFMRGVPFVQLPTTLLAHVDSSVGGKTAVDLPAGKNLVGAFIQPRLVLADTETLATLPEGEWSSGLAEVVKSGILGSESLMSWMEAHARELRAREPETVARAVEECVAFKAGVVESDEHERGARESLNYGHTLGHALETVAGYGAYSHGAAVAEGMRFAARLSERVLGTSREYSERQGALLDAVGLPARPVLAEPDQLRQVMGADKKARGGRPRFVLSPAPGEYTVAEVDDAILVEELSSWVTGRRSVTQ